MSKDSAFSQALNCHNVYGTVFVEPSFSNEEVIFLDAFIKAHHSKVNHLKEFIYNNLNSNNIKEQNKELTKENLHVLIGEILSSVNTEPNQFTPGTSCTLKILIDSQGNYNQITVNKENKNKDKSCDWISFFIEHFFKKDCIAKTLYPKELSFLKQHNINGEIWQKTSIPWLAHKILIKDNNVILFLASTPVSINYKKNNTIETKIVNINRKNSKSVFSDPNIVLKHKSLNQYYKQYYDTIVETIVKTNSLSNGIPIKYQVNELLEKMLLAAQLNNNLHINLVGHKINKI